MLKNTRKNFKSFITVLLTFVILFTTFPTATLASTNITDIGNNSAKFGVIEGTLSKLGHELHYAKYDGKTYITFCTQFGVKSPTGKEYNKNEFRAYRNNEQVRSYLPFFYAQNKPRN